MGARRLRSGLAANRDYLCVGVILRPHGVKGLVLAHSFMAQDKDMLAYGALFDEEGNPHAFSLQGRAKGCLILAAHRVDNRDQASRLRGLRLYVERSAFPPANETEDEWYLHDLIGLEMRSPFDTKMGAGTPIGVVSMVWNFGAGDLLEIAPFAGGTSILLPFRREFVPDLSLSEGWASLSKSALLFVRENEGEGKEAPKPRPLKTPRPMKPITNQAGHEYP